MKLSATMIVRDEEKLLSQCLDSIKGIIDEIILVDTGSVDRTMDIACEYEAKVFEHPWQRDFAYHRNQAFDYATGDWMLVIDPDEELAPIKATKEKLKERFTGLPKNVYALVFTLKNKSQAGNITSTSQSLRFFRNSVGVKYEGYVHNYAVLPSGGHAAPSDFVMYHYGYDLDEETMRRKFDRSSTLLYKRLRENPDDYEACYFLCNLLALHEKWDEAIKYGQMALNLLPETFKKNYKLTSFASLYHTLGMMLCIRKHEVYEGLRWIMEGLNIFPENLDLNYDVVHIGTMFNNGNVTKDMRRHGQIYLKLYDLYQGKPHLALGQSFMTMNEEYKGRIEKWLNQN